MLVMVGARNSSADGTTKVSIDSYSDGVKKENFAVHADQVVSGTYGRAVGTKDGGARTKEFQASLQTQRADMNENSDCGTTYTKRVFMTKDIIGYHMWAYVRTDKGTLVQITPRNKSQFLNKWLNVRSVLFCKNTKYCAKCAGGLFSSIGLENIGLVCQDIPITIQGLDMKKFHNNTIKSTPDDFTKYFYDY